MSHSAAYEGQSDKTSGFVDMVENMGFVRSESMDIQNDPRFFQHNVIDKRLAAFHGLGVVSSIMVKTAMGQIFGMKKDIKFSTFDPSKDTDGWAQILGFVLMTFVLFFNTIATYTTIAQIYHTYRLMTAGPTGFEMATSYYLNKNIIFWRHFAVKCMLVSLPIFLASSGLRLLVKFDRDMVKKPMWISEVHPTALPLPEPHVGTINGFGIIVCLVYVVLGCLVQSVHHKHMAVFRERYELVMVREGEGVQSLLTHVQTLSHRGRNHVPDV